MATLRCGYEGCRNIISANARACYLHDGLGPESYDIVEVKASMAENAKAVVGIYAHDPQAQHVLLNPETCWGNGTRSHHDSLQSETPIAEDAIRAVDTEIARLGGRDRLNQPADAGSAMSEFPEFVSGLESSLGRKRVSVLRLYGFNRRIDDGRVQSSAEGYNEVVVIDKGTDSEVVVDPFIAVFAPVLDPTKPVDDQTASGDTPFGDVPWIGTVNDYVAGGQMWWDRAEYR